MDYERMRSHSSSPPPSSHSSSPSHSPPTFRGRFYRPRPNRSVSPVRRPPVVTLARPIGDDVRPMEPLYPWRRPPVVAASPAFEPETRNFIPGDVKNPTDLFSYLSHEDAQLARRWLKTIKIQHRAYSRRHAELVQMMQDMERGMRRLEADPADWEKFGFDKVDPMPMCLRDYCRSRRGRGN